MADDDMLKPPGPLSSDPESEPNMGPHEPFPTRYKLTRIEPLQKNVEVDSADRVYRGIEFEPSKDKKYMFSVEVGDAPPRDAQETINQAVRMFKKFMGDVPFLVLPCRNGHPVVGIYEITPEK